MALSKWWATVFELDPTKEWMDDEGVLIFYDWCNEHFGERDFRNSAGTWRWTVQGFNPTKVCFRESKDALLFKLRWL